MLRTEYDLQARKEHSFSGIFKTDLTYLLKGVNLETTDHLHFLSGIFMIL
jgi:hypothetical protein